MHKHVGDLSHVPQSKAHPVFQLCDTAQVGTVKPDKATSADQAADSLTKATARSAFERDSAAMLRELEQKEGTCERCSYGNSGPIRSSTMPATRGTAPRGGHDDDDERQCPKAGRQQTSRQDEMCL
jgi:hypothetical protein